MYVVIVDQEGIVSHNQFHEVLWRLQADNPSFTPYDPVEAERLGHRMGRCQFEIHDLADHYPHRGILRGPCVRFCDRIIAGEEVMDALKALSVVYPKLAFGIAWLGDESHSNRHHCLLQNGELRDSQFDGASYHVQTLCTPQTHFFDCIVPRTLSERARVKMLRARRDIVKLAETLQSEGFLHHEMRKYCDLAKTAKVAEQMRVAADALKVLDGLDFERVIAEDIPQPWFASAQVEAGTDSVRAVEDL